MRWTKLVNSFETRRHCTNGADGRAASSYIAVFALEELGKAETLFSLASEAANRGPKTAAQVMKGLTTHRTKLRSGRGALSITAGVSFWGDIPEPGTPEMQEIERKLTEAQRIAEENAPGEAHAARMRALYVDLGDGEVWRRPMETAASDAYLMLSAASIEYGVRRTKFMNPTDAATRQALLDTVQRVGDLPEAPVVNWPRT